MKRRALFLVFVLSLGVLAACGGATTELPIAIRVSQVERVLGPQYEQTLAVTMLGFPEVMRRERVALLTREVVAAKVRQAAAATAAREAEAARVAAEVKAAEEVAAAEARLAEEEAERVAAAQRRAVPPPRSTPTTVAASRSSGTSALAVSSGGSGRCGGNLPPCSVMMAESGGDPNAVNATGCGGRGCYGKWQFDPLTSQSLGYDRPMNEYPEGVQDEAAAKLLARSGCSQWSTC